MLNLATKLSLDSALRLSPNLCARFTDDDLKQIGGYCFQGYTNDRQSRSAWESRMEAAMNLAMQIAQAKNFPWQGASNVILPLISIGALQFSARSYSNIVQGTEVVKYRVIGENPSAETTARAYRIACHMSWQVTEQDSGWEEQTDKQLINLSIVGSNFKKSYFSGKKGHNVSELVMAKDLVMDYYARSVEDCTRKTHVIQLFRNDIVEKCRSGVFRDVLEEAWFKAAPIPAQSSQKPQQDARHGVSPPQADDEAPFTFLEQHRFFDFDDDGYAEPYIVTLEATSQEVVRIVARWELDEDIEKNDAKQVVRIKAMEYFTGYEFIPSPDGSVYGLGFGVMLGPLNEASNSLVNQLIDCGTMNNSGGGFLGRGAKFKGGVYTVAPWEWKRVDSSGDDLRKNVIPMETREPSMALFKLLELLINYIQRLSGATDIMQGETPGQNTPAETSRNALEQGMQIYSTIFKRIWRSMKEEFKKLHRLNAIYLPIRQPFGEKGQFVLREDYKSNGDLVVPVADPSVTSDAQRMQRAQAVRVASKEAPGYDIEAVERNFLKAMRVENVDQLYGGLKKFPPGQSEKISIEQMRAKLKQGQAQLSWQQFRMTLAEQHRLNTAQIAKLEADALALMATADDAKAAHHLQVLQVAIDAFKHHNDTITDRMGIAQQAQQADQEQEQADAAQSTAE